MLGGKPNFRYPDVDSSQNFVELCLADVGYPPLELGKPAWRDRVEVVAHGPALLPVSYQVDERERPWAASLIVCRGRHYQAWAVKLIFV